jgi:hypothetical protein
MTNTAQTYKDRKGNQWLLVANTPAGVYGWFRPVEHPNDGWHDKHCKIASMRAALAAATNGSK